MDTISAHRYHRTVHARRPLRTDERGQAFVEMGIVVALLVTLLIGILELGRTWMVINMITQATREGARAAAVTPTSNRSTSGSGTACPGAPGCILGTSGVTTQVRNEIAAVLGSTAANGFSVDVTQPTVDGVNVVTVTTTGTVNMMFNLIGTGFSVNRSVTFKDEGR